MKDRYVIRANGGESGYVFWMSDPFEDRYDIVYHFASHPCNAAYFEGKQGKQQAQEIVNVLPIKHAKPHVVSLETALDEHGEQPPAPFPFNVFSIPTDDDIERANEPDDIETPPTPPAPAESLDIFSTIDEPATERG